MRSSRFIIILIVLIIFSALLFFWQNALYRVPDFIKNPTTNNSTATEQPKLSRPIVRASDPMMGNPEAPITIVEFGDFQCSYCAEMSPVLEKLVKKYPEKIKLVWKDAPNVSLHSQSIGAAQAAHCANEQEKFWEYHEGLFANQNQLNRDLYLQLARGLNLKMNNFEECLINEKYASTVQDNLKEALALQIDGTPYYFIDEKRLSGTASLEELEKLIIQ